MTTYDPTTNTYVHVWGSRFMSVYTVHPESTLNLPDGSRFRVATLNAAEQNAAWYAVWFTVQRRVIEFGGAKGKRMITFAASEREVLTGESLATVLAIVARSQNETKSV